MTKRRGALEAPASTALVVSSDALRPELERAATTASAILAALESVTIDTPEDALAVDEKLHVLKTRWKFYEEQRTSVTRPINASLDTINAWFKGVQGPLKQAEEVLKKKVGDYQRRCKAAQQQAMLEVAAGDSTALVRTAPPEALPGMSVRDTWVPEVEVPDVVPREFCSPDMAKLRAASNASTFSETNPPPAIAGVKFTLRARVAVR